MKKLGMCMNSNYYVLPPLKGKTVLEIGCNEGWLATYIMEQEPTRYLGVDLWPHKSVRESIQSSELFTRFQYGDITDRNSLPYNQSWDVVIMFGVFYHLIDPLQALINLRDLTKETLVIGTAFHLGCGTFMHFEPGYWGDPSNYWYPTKECLLKMLSWLGLVSEVKFIWEESKVVGCFHDRICIHGSR